MSPICQAVAVSVFPNIGGWVGSICVSKNYDKWYKNLKKPSWNPPRYVFAPVWTGLYTGMGYASYLVWKEGGGFNEKTAVPLGLYASQLALNWAWTPIFFGCHSLKWGVINIVALTGVAAATAVTFHSINRTAGCLMVPYVAWLAFASSLTVSIYHNNQDDEETEESTKISEPKK